MSLEYSEWTGQRVQVLVHLYSVLQYSVRALDSPVGQKSEFLRKSCPKCPQLLHRYVHMYEYLCYELYQSVSVSQNHYRISIQYWFLEEWEQYTIYCIPQSGATIIMRSCGQEISRCLHAGERDSAHIS